MRQQVADACLALLAEGASALGPVEVAARAGVSRATLHRWWPRRADLLREALARHTGTLATPDTGTWAGDVRALARGLAAFFADPAEVSLNALMASGNDPAFTEIVLDHYAPIVAAWREVIERARTRGELREGVDADAVVSALVSPLVLVPLLYRRPLSRRQVDAIVSLVVDATRAGPEGPAPSSRSVSSSADDQT